MRKVDLQSNMRKNIFNDSQVYMGFSSTKRDELAKSLKLPNEYRSQLYKQEEPISEFNHKTLVQRRGYNRSMSGIREYTDTRRDVLDSLSNSHTRSTSCIFGLQNRSHQ